MMSEQAETLVRELALREMKVRMDKFLKNISHELLTQLTTIKGNIQLANKRLEQFERRSNLEGPVVTSDLNEIRLMLKRAELQIDMQNRLISNLTDTMRIQFDSIEPNNQQI